jgi:hypothetical protein
MVMQLALALVGMEGEAGDAESAGGVGKPPHRQLVLASVTPPADWLTLFASAWMTPWMVLGAQVVDPAAQTP